MGEVQGEGQDEGGSEGQGGGGGEHINTPRRACFTVQGGGQGEGGSEHIKHAQTGMFYVFAVFGQDQTGGVLAVERLVVVVVVLNGDGGRCFVEKTTR